MLICGAMGCGAQNRAGARFCWQCGNPLLLSQGMQVGHYRILGVIGQGGFGAVYEAEDMRHSGRQVALKETFDPNHISSFAKEFQVLHGLTHPHLPRYHEMFQERKRGYLVMELVPGQNLAELLHKKGAALPSWQVMIYAPQLCDVLTYLHNKQILHRDIKPANIRLTPEGVIKLVDFGLIKQGGGVTRSSRRGLTPPYASIEQWDSTQQTSPRSDIYSLGATFYHLLTNQAPLPATNRVTTHPDPLPPPEQLNPQLDAHIAKAVMKAMKLRPDERYANAVALKQALMGIHSPIHNKTTVVHKPAPPSPVPKHAPPTVVHQPKPTPIVPKPAPPTVAPKPLPSTRTAKALQPKPSATSSSEGE